MKTIEQLWKLLKDVELIQVRPSEMEALYKHCFEFEMPVIVEVGCAHGASSIILAEAANELGGVLHCYDPFPNNYYNQDKFGDYAKEAFLKNMKPYRNDYILHEAKSNECDLSPIDVLFIDGDHNYEDVLVDCNNLLPLLKSGGYVGFHDYNNVAFSGVKKAVDETCAGWPTTDDVWDLIIKRKP